MTARILIAGAIGPAARILADRLRRDYLSVSLQGGEAAAQARVLDWRPDLIVLECASDDTEWAFYRSLRSDPASRHTPILLLLSGAGDPALRLRGLELGAEDVLTAPVDMELLSARLQVILRSRRLRDEWRIRRDDLPRLGLAADMPTPSSVAGARVLLIDDDDPSVAMVRDALGRDGVATGAAATAAQAATLCAAVAFDLVLLNLGLITDDPLRVVADLRADDATRQVPLLLLAPSPLRQRLLRGLALGANDWLAWPPGGPEATAELRARSRTRLRQKFRQDRLRADLAHAFEVALTDPLTGCYNRRHFGRQLQALLAAAPAQGVALLLIDIDHFTSVNERLGYAAADMALVQLAELLRGEVRGLDSVARLGGEEFVVVMPGCGLADATQSGERLCRTIRDHVFAVAPGERLSLTVSVGVASGDGSPVAAPLTQERLLHHARRARDAVRLLGGNAVSVETEVLEAAAAD